MQDAWRAYLELALGLTDASKKRAQAAARKLVGSSGATAAQLQTMAEELLSTGMANREALTRMIRVEIDRTLGALGLATGEEVAALTERVGNLERELAAARGTAPGGTGLEPEAEGARKVAATKAVAKKTVAKKTVAKKTVAKKTVAKKTLAKKAAAADAPAKKAVAKKAAPGRAVVAKKAAPGKTVARRTATPGGGAA
ncbi:histone H1-like repetitive region-containing protein [Plantactinospora sp. WMMC1484]|uniref:phasin family protein n=1 Tax=Plantactinospora sp. WMMC1484 TaxID=3404122 RepID=UPI003BF4A7B0